jgi:hypothetical protein
MRYFLALIFLVFSSYLGFTQFSDYRIAYRIRIYNNGIYYFNYQREPYPETYGIRYDDFLATGNIYSPNYEQYENIIFFKSYGGRNIIYDRAHSRVFYTDMDNIDSVIFTDNHTLTIRGFHIKEEYDYWGRKTIFLNKITEEITITYGNLEMERISWYYDWNISELIGKEIPKNEIEGQTESFIYPLEQEGNRYFLFNFWDRYVIVDCTQLLTRYSIIKNIIAMYNTTFDQYFIFVDAYSGDR